MVTFFPRMLFALLLVCSKTESPTAIAIAMMTFLPMMFALYLVCSTTIITAVRSADTNTNTNSNSNSSNNNVEIIIRNEQDDNDNHEYAQGAQVINAILADLWQGMGKDILANMRANPMWIDPYLLKLKGGKLRSVPTIRNIQMLSPFPSPSTAINNNNSNNNNDNNNHNNNNNDNNTASSSAPPPPRFECGIVYEGQPEMELVLTGANGFRRSNKQQQQYTSSSQIRRWFQRTARTLVPDIQVQVNSMHLRAHLEVTLDMRHKIVTFHFLERPHVEWDLEFSVTKAEIPLFGDDQLETLLTNVLEGIGPDNPIRIKL